MCASDFGMHLPSMNKMWIKTLRNFLVANICVLWPVLWIGLSWVPDMVKVETRDGVEVCLVYHGETMRGEESGWWGEGPVWRFFLPRGAKWTDFCIQTDGDGEKEDLGTIWLQKWLFKFGRSGTELSKREGKEKTWGLSDGCRGKIRLASRTVAVGLLGLETLLALSSRGFARRRPNSGEKGWCGAMGVGLVLAFVMEVVLPLQSYLANASLFPYLWGDLLPALAVRFAVAAVLAMLALRTLEYCFGRWTLGLALAFVVCAYLESGVLSMGLPTLKGGWWFFENPSRALWDTLVWMFVFVVMLSLSHPLHEHWGKTAACVAILSASSLLDVKREEKIDTSKFVVNELLPIATVIQSVEYSPTKNILIFVIDSLEREQAHAAMEDEQYGAKLRAQFKGFTEYLDNVGTGSDSLVAVANLLTGDYPESVAGIVDYYESVFSSKSVLGDCLENGWDVFLAPSALGHGYTNQKKNLFEEEAAMPVVQRPIVEGQPWNLAEFCRFRWMPFALKARFLWLAPKGLSRSSGVGWSREWKLFPALEKAPVSESSKGTFAFFHTSGVHIPVDYNRNGELMQFPDNSDHGCVEMAVFLLSQLAELFDSYRERGIYDNSLIVVLADHGHHAYLENDFSEKSGTLPGAARPFLWVKPIGAMEDFATSILPTSHARICNLLRRSIHENLGADAIHDVLCVDEEDRVFRTLSLLTREKDDWVVNKNGSVSVRHGILGEGSTGPRVALKSGVGYSLDVDQVAQKNLDIAYDNLFAQRELGMGPSARDMQLRFRVENPACRYTVRLTMSMKRIGTPPDNEGACMEFHLNGIDRREKAPRSSHLEVVLEHAVPDGDGWITINGIRGDGLNSFVYFHNLTVTAED